MSASPYRKYALYNRGTGVVNRFITALPEMFREVTWMEVEDDVVEVDMFTPPGNYKVVGGQLEPYTPEV